MTTVGYGDMVVRTNLTRLMIFIVAMFGAMIFPVLVISIKNTFQISRNEEMSIAIIEQVKIKRILREKAALVIPYFFKLRRELICC